MTAVRLATYLLRMITVYFANISVENEYCLDWQYIR